jgi:hypothetical protein
MPLNLETDHFFDVIPPSLNMSGQQTEESFSEKQWREGPLDIRQHSKRETAMQLSLVVDVKS